MERHKKWNIEHFKRLAEYNARLEKIMRDSIIKSASLVSRHNQSATKDDLFYFNSDSQLNAGIDSILSDLSNEITSVTSNAEVKEWNLAYAQETDYISQLYKVALQTNNLKEGYSDLMLSMRSRNLDALEEFKKRKIGGMNLSGRVWNYTERMKQQMEVSIDTALMTGMSADRLAVSLLDLLKNPDALFRRVRDENDELRMSRAMKAYHPGNGVYRSAYKNAMRLARSEINIAYRSSDSQTAQMLDCVVGIRINLSNNHTCNGEPFVDICDQLKGDYPKDFKFVGWHPQCRCFITYINKTDEEFWRDLENGENNDSVNTVKDVPKQFKDWLDKNEKRIEGSRERGTLPYFLKDNEKYVVFNVQGNKIKVVEYKPQNLDNVISQMISDEQIYYATNGDFSSLEDYLNFHGLTLKEAQELLNKCIEDSDIYMAINPKILSKLISEDGEFKNSLQTGKGTFKTIGDKRAIKERLMFGIQEGTDYEHYPKYGFLSSKGQMSNENIPTWGYGNTYVRFDKDKIGGRCCFTFGDSYDGNRFSDIETILYEVEQRASWGDEKAVKLINALEKLKENGADSIFYQMTPSSPLNNPDISSLLSFSKYGRQNLPTKERLTKGINDITLQTGNYVECQMYGKISISDVTQIETQSIKAKNDLEKVLKKQGLNIDVVASKYDSRLIKLLSKDYDDETLKLVSSLRSSDVDKLGDRYIENLFERFKPNERTIKEYPKNLQNYNLQTIEEKRDYVRKCYEHLENGDMREFYQNYRKKNIIGFIDDVLNKELLN